MTNELKQPNEAVVTAVIVGGNPAVCEKDPVYDQRGHYQVKIAVEHGSKSEEQVNSAMKVALDHGEKHYFRRYSLVEPKTPCSEGDAECLRNPLAKGKLVIKAKSTTMPLLMGIDGAEDTDPGHWIPGTKVKAVINFNPYSVETTDGVSAAIKAMVVIERSESASLKDRATALFSAYGEDE